MKSYTFLLIFCFISYSLAENTYIVRIGWKESVPNQFRVVYLSRSHCLVLANEKDLQKIKRFDKQVKIIDTNPSTLPNSKYYAVYPDIKSCPKINSDIFAQYGAVLDNFDQLLIMKGDAENLLLNTFCQVDLVEISLEDDINPYRNLTIQKHEPVKYDPLIEQVLSKISPDSCARLLRDLCGIYNRFAREHWNIDEVVPYLERKFTEYNCDSIFRLPVNGYDAPAVVGVRKGKKDPSLDRVCLIGAHPDNICDEGGRHQGAYDNGCGCVGYLEAARVMQNFTFENTILFAAFNAEEVGLLGSREIVDQLLDNGTEIIGGAVTYDMVGIAPSSSGAISHAVCTSVQGGQEFADKIEELGDTYNFPVNISTQSSTDIPTDTKHFWKEGYAGSCGRGGTGGQYHTKADSINETFDSLWLAKALTPGIATIAYYAVPMEVTGANFIQLGGFTNPVTIQNNPSGFLTITLSGSRLVHHQRVSIYTVSGKLVQTLVLSKKTGSKYSGTWNYSSPRGYAVGRGLYLITGTINNKRFQKKVIISR